MTDSIRSFDRSRKITKMVVGLTVGLGTTRIVKGIVVNNAQPTSKTDKVTLTAGSFVIGSMASDATMKYTETYVDKFYDVIVDLKEAIADSKNQAKTPVK